MLILNVNSGDSLTLGDLGSVRVVIDDRRTNRIQLQIKLDDIRPIKHVKEAPRGQPNNPRGFPKR